MSDTDNWDWGTIDLGDGGTIGFRRSLAAGSNPPLSPVERVAAYAERLKGELTEARERIAELEECVYNGNADVAQALGEWERDCQRLREALRKARNAGHVVSARLIIDAALAATELKEGE